MVVQKTQFLKISEDQLYQRMSVGDTPACNSNDKKKAPARKAPPAVPTTPSNVWNPSIYIFSKHFMPRWSLQLHLSAEIERFFDQTRGFSNGIPLWDQVQIRSQRLFYLKNRVWSSSTLIESFSVLRWSYELIFGHDNKRGWYFHFSWKKSPPPPAGGGRQKFENK